MLGRCFQLKKMELVFTGANFFFLFGFLLPEWETVQSSPRCWALGAEGAGGQEGLGLSEAPAALWPLGHKECALGRKGPHCGAV